MMKTGEAIVRGYPRLHLGLIDLARATDRAYGGAGVAVDALPTVIRAERDGKARVITSGFASEDASAVTELLEECGLLRTGCGIRLTLEEQPLRHVGLGTGTTMRLVALAATATALGRPAHRLDLQHWSGRGGTSGVGVHSFFRGGLVVDAGRPQSDVGVLEPSYQTSPQTVPLLMRRVTMPRAWHVYLFVPTQLIGSSAGAVESSFFAAQTPVPEHEVLVSLATLYHGIVPAIAERDFNRFKTALALLQGTGFKAREIRRYGGIAANLLEELNESRDIAAGMSSMGPLIFAMTPTCRHLPFSITQDDVILLAGAHFRNRGFEVEA